MARLPWDMTGKVVLVTGGNAGICADFPRPALSAGPFGAGAPQHAPHVISYRGSQGGARHIHRIVDQGRVESVFIVRGVPDEDAGQNHDGDEPLPFLQKPPWNIRVCGMEQVEDVIRNRHQIEKTDEMLRALRRVEEGEDEARMSSLACAVDMLEQRPEKHLDQGPCLGEAPVRLGVSENSRHLQLDLRYPLRQYRADEPGDVPEMVLDRVVVPSSGGDADLTQGDTFEAVPSVKLFGGFHQPVGNRGISSDLWVVSHALSAGCLLAAGVGSYQPAGASAPAPAVMCLSAAARLAVRPPLYRSLHAFYQYFCTIEAWVVS